MTAASATETAQFIRSALKAAFPGVKFSVRTDDLTIRVRWTDGPIESDVKAVAARFETRDFGADYIFTQRSLSAAFKARLDALAGDILGEPVDESKWYDPVRGQYVTEFGTWRSATGYNLLCWLAEHVPAES